MFHSIIVFVYKKVKVNLVAQREEYETVYPLLSESCAQESHNNSNDSLYVTCHVNNNKKKLYVYRVGI